VVRGLRTNLQLATLDSPVRTLLVTSAGAGEGKSTLVRELALAYNEAGLRVAVIECDLRRPTIGRLMKVDPEPGLTQVLLDECGLAEAVQQAHVEVSSDQHAAVAVGSGVSSNGRAGTAATLSVLTGGGQIANPPTVLGAQRMRRLIETSREHNDIVIIDSSPLLGVADTFPLLALVDGTILVARLGVATRASARRAREIIDRIPGAEVLGVVANDVPRADFTDVGYGAGYDGRGDAPVNRMA
jgi:Mrp family chromosome partitioning ATPase